MPDAYKNLNPKQWKSLGSVPFDLSFENISAQRWFNAKIFTPILFYFSLFCSFVIVSIMLSMFVKGFLQPNPVLLVAFPDGSVRCAIGPINPQTHQLLPKTAAQEKMCQQLEQRYQASILNGQQQINLMENNSSGSTSSPTPASSSLEKSKN